MNSDSEKQIEGLRNEIQELHKDIAYLKGEQAGRTRMINIILPIAMILFGILSFTALGTFFNNLFTEQLKQMVDEKLTSEEFSGIFQEYIVAAQNAVEQAKDEAKKAQDASADSQTFFGLAEDKANQAEQSAKTAEVQANEAGQAAETAQVQASEVAVKATEVQEVISTPTPP